MPNQARNLDKPLSVTLLLAACVALAVPVVVLWPDIVLSTIRFVAMSLIAVAPLVIPGIVLAAWVIASGADAHIANLFEGRLLYAIFAASAIGAVTPVCGVTVLPMMAGLLAAGVPLAPVMAFWLSSPITDPAMLAATAATLGVSFAVGKTVAAFGLGLWGGAMTAAFSDKEWARFALRNNRIVGQLARTNCDTPMTFDPIIWMSIDRRAKFRLTFLSTTRLILICLIPAFAAEFALNALLRPEALSDYVGVDVWWAIPFAVFVGAPAYLDGYAALPLTRGLMDHGMSPGAAMAFLVSGGVVSIWGALAIFPVLKLKPFLLYLVLAVTGSLAAGYLFEWIV